MASETVVVDGTNLQAIIAEATGVPMEISVEPSKPEVSKPETTQEVKGEKTPQEADVVKAAATPEKAAKPDAVPQKSLDEKKAAEDPDGLTKEERESYTAKMRKSVAWRHGKMREAQELAQRERQGRLAAEEKAAAAQRELEQLRGQKVEPKKESQEPKQEDFAKPEEYMAARVKWEVAQELAKDREQRRKDAEEAEKTRILDAARARIVRAMELVPDFQEVIESVDLVVPQHLAAYMQESEMLAELGYFFAQHPDELERLSKLKPAVSLVAIGKIESTLQPFAAPIEEPAKVEANGATPKPSTAADGIPSRPRVTVPVVQPLTTRGAPEVESPAHQNVSQSVKSFEKRTGAALTRRARH